MNRKKTGYERLGDLWLDVRVGIDLSDSEAYNIARRLTGEEALSEEAARADFLIWAGERSRRRQDEKLAALDAFETAWRGASGRDRAAFAVDLGLAALAVPAYLRALRADFLRSAADEQLTAGVLTLAAQLAPAVNRPRLWAEVAGELVRGPVAIRPDPIPETKRVGMVLVLVILMFMSWWRSGRPGAGRPPQLVQGSWVWGGHWRPPARGAPTRQR